MIQETPLSAIIVDLFWQTRSAHEERSQSDDATHAKKGTGYSQWMVYS